MFAPRKVETASVCTQNEHFSFRRRSKVHRRKIDFSNVIYQSLEIMYRRKVGEQWYMSWSNFETLLKNQFNGWRKVVKNGFFSRKREKKSDVCLSFLFFFIRYWDINNLINNNKSTIRGKNNVYIFIRYFKVECTCSDNAILCIIFKIIPYR